MLGAGFFACLSMAIAGLAGTRDRLMGFGQVLTMPLFFASNALYPIEIMPTWLQVVSHVNPLTYLVDALRGLLIGTPAHLTLDFAVLLGATAVGIWVSGALLGRWCGDDGMAGRPAPHHTPGASHTLTSRTTRCARHLSSPPPLCDSDECGAGGAEREVVDRLRVAAGSAELVR